MLVAVVMVASTLVAVACGSDENRVPGPGETRTVAPDAKPQERDIARALLASLAAAAVKQPGIAVQDTDLIYVRAEETAAGVPQVHEVWLEPDGLIARRIAITGGGNDYVFPRSGQWAPDDEENVRKAYAMLAKQGPSLSRPTRSWIAELPTDPDALIRQLAGDTSADGTSVALIEGLLSLFSKAWPLVDPGQREPLYMALAKVASVGADSLEPVRVGGREVYSIFLVRDESGSQELLFDPQTGLPVGTRISPQVWSFWTMSVVDRR